MTFKQFDEQLNAYALAFSVRDRRLLIIFFILLGLAVATTISVAFVSKTSIYLLFKIILGAMVCLAAYTVLSSRQFHKRYGVNCSKCGASLTALGETLEMIEAGEIERPMMLSCPRCKEVVVKDDV
jgi:hypothetical protein